MNCIQSRPLFTAYLDSTATGAEMHALSEHLGECSECHTEYRKLDNTRMLVSSLGR